MKSVCYLNIIKFMDYLNDNGGRSFDRIRSLKIDNKFNKLMDYFNVEKCFKNIFLNFIGILDNPLLNDYPNFKKIKLYENDLFDCFKKYGFEFSVYFDNEYVYSNFPLFFQTVCKHYGIDKYANMDIIELDIELNKYIDMQHVSSYKNDVKIMFKSLDNKNKYDKYINSKKQNSLNLNNVDDLYIYCEDYTCFNEDILLKDIGCKSIWVAKDYGDGYGYDVLSYNYVNGKEKLIEVKSGHTYNFTLSKNEYKTMVETTKLGIGEYFVYKYTRNAETGIINFNIYKYDLYNDILVDLNYNDNYCRLTPDQTFNVDTGKREVVFYANVDNVRKR